MTVSTPLSTSVPFVPFCGYLRSAAQISASDRLFQFIPCQFRLVTTQRLSRLQSKLLQRAKAVWFMGMSVFLRPVVSILFALVTCPAVLDARPPAMLGDPPPAPTPEEVARLPRRGISKH